MLVARTCDVCGVLRPAASFTLSTGGYRGRECRGCQSRRRRAKWDAADYAQVAAAERQRRRKWDNDRRETVAAEHLATERRHNARSLDSAQRHRQDWTLAEMKVVGREDLTARQAAELLGRSYFAVSKQRSRMKKSDNAAEA